MSGTFSRSYRLMKASLSILSQDRRLFVLALFNASLVAMLLGGYFSVAYGLGWFHPDGFDPVFYIGLPFLNFAVGLVVGFFQTALVGMVMLRLDGQNPGLREGFALAYSRIGAIAGYAVIGGVIGMVIGQIQERFGFLGRFASGLVGIGWTLATFLIFPILAANNIGPIEAIKRSASLFRRTWGENVIANSGMSVALGAMGGLLLAIGIIVGTLLIAFKFVILGVLILGICAAAVSALLIFGLGLSGVYSALLYRFATGGALPPGIEEDLLRGAFVAR